MSTQRPELTDQELWQTLATGPVRAAGAVSDTDLAEWLEGRLSEAEAARIETAVAGDPELRQMAIELGEVLALPLPAAPNRLVVRAQALVGFDAERGVPRNSVLATVLGWRASVQRAVMASLAMLVAVTGFMMGGGLGESYAQERQGKVQVPDTLSELSDFFSDGI
jgi:hypothetical protein